MLNKIKEDRYYNKYNKTENIPRKYDKLSCCCTCESPVAAHL